MNAPWPGKIGIGPEMTMSQIVNNSGGEIEIFLPPGVPNLGSLSRRFRSGGVLTNQILVVFGWTIGLLSGMNDLRSTLICENFEKNTMG